MKIEEYRNQKYTIVGYEHLLTTGDQSRIASKLRTIGYEAVWWKETSGHEPHFGDTLIMINDSDQTLYLYPSGRLQNHSGCIIQLEDLGILSEDNIVDLLKDISRKLDIILAKKSDREISLDLLGQGH